MEGHTHVLYRQTVGDFTDYTNIETWTHWLCRIPAGGGDGARQAELTATWAASKGRFDGQKGKDYGYRDQHDGWKGRFTWYQSTDD